MTVAVVAYLSLSSLVALRTPRACVAGYQAIDRLVDPQPVDQLGAPAPLIGLAITLVIRRITRKSWQLRAGRPSPRPDRSKTLHRESRERGPHATSRPARTHR